MIKTSIFLLLLARFAACFVNARDTTTRRKQSATLSKVNVSGRNRQPVAIQAQSIDSGR